MIARQPDTVLLLDDVADHVVLDRRQLVGRQLTVAPALAGLGEVARAQQAADVVAASRQDRHHYLRRRVAAVPVRRGSWGVHDGGGEIGQPPFEHRGTRRRAAASIRRTPAGVGVTSGGRTIGEPM